MQFVEKNSYDLRVAVYTLKKQGCGLEFLLIPMIHVGSKEYYDGVRQRLLDCDLILAEGLKSRKVRALLSHQVINRYNRLGLVSQRDGLNLADIRDRVVLGDIGTERFDRGWKHLPLLHRAIAFVLAPAVFSYRLIWSSRESLARELVFDDLPSRTEVMMDSEANARFDKLIVGDRDNALIDKIKGLQASAGDGRRLVGVPWGAGHMRGLCAYLLNRAGYKIVRSEWLTVFVI